MQLEIQVALNFLISYLYNRLPRRRVNIFGEELERQLQKKYQGHWYPDAPYRGSAFRCLQVGQKVDPVVQRAAQESGLDLEDVRHNLPQDLSVWIDPREVSYQIGDKGPVKVLYVDDSNVTVVASGGLDLDQELKTSFNPEAQVFLPISEPLVSPASSSPSPPFSHSAAGSPTFTPRSAQPPLTFTTAAFAATKFGSTKMKSGGRNNNNNNGGAVISNNNNIAVSAGSKPTRSSPTNTKQNALPGPLLYGLGPGPVLGPGPGLGQGLGLGLGLGLVPGSQQQQKPSALSPNAKEFVFHSLQGPGSPGGSLFSGEGPLQHRDPFQLLLRDKSLMDGLGLSLASMQFSNQQFQPVMAT